MKQHILWMWLAPILCIVALGVLLSATEAGAQPVAAERTCNWALSNGGFEEDTDWVLPITAYPASYSSDQPHSGARSLRAGILQAADNKFSYSSANQPLALPTAVPTDVQTATLTLWWWPISSEGPLTGTLSAAADQATLQALVDGVTPAAPLEGDRQYVILTDESNNVVASLLWTRSNAQEWQQLTFDLTPYLGRNLRLHIGVMNDGVGGVTALYADDVAAEFCTGIDGIYLPEIRNSPTVTPTVEPPPTSTVVWTDPSQAIEVFSPVADGLYHSPIEVRGFSRTFEGVVNLRLSGADGQVLAERVALGGSVDGFAFFETYLRFIVSEEMTGTLEVFEESANDGSEINKVSIPLTLLPGQRVVDLDMPETGAVVCNPIYVSGYSNTFEATVLVTLNARNGAELAVTTAMGGNLGVYADFSTTISHTVDAPQPVLVGVTEGSAAGFGYIDYTRVPVSLDPECPQPD